MISPLWFVSRSDLTLGHREHQRIRSWRGCTGVCASWTVTGASGLARLRQIIIECERKGDLAVGIWCSAFEAGDTWRWSNDWTLSGMCPVISTGASGHLESAGSGESMTLFEGAPYIRCLASSSSPCELSQSPSTHLHHWFFIFVRLGENPSVLLECLHLEALGVHVLLWDSLVTLGGCSLLDGLEQ
jgi:hypothetical protein